MKRFLFLAVCIFSLLPPLLGQENRTHTVLDTLHLEEKAPGRLAEQDTLAAPILSEAPVAKPYVNPWSLAIPAVLIARGAFSMDSHFDHKLQRYVAENVKGKVRADDYVQYLPIASVFAFPNLGLPPAHSLKERLVIGATAYALTAIFVNTTKYTVRHHRPDTSTRNSFPSGHTATVFTGVEILYQEYKHYDPWIGIGGYAVAAGVGLLRIHNNRHWASDVVAGAGIGILSAKLSYLLFPYTSRILGKRKQPLPTEKAIPETSSSLSVLPIWEPTHNTFGAALTLQF
ncbi:phosphatase PAP2 family protein [Capnocytophaga gingivalis]